MSKEEVVWTEADSREVHELMNELEIFLDEAIAEAEIKAREEKIRNAAKAARVDAENLAKKNTLDLEK